MHIGKRQTSNEAHKIVFEIENENSENVSMATVDRICLM